MAPIPDAKLKKALNQKLGQADNANVSMQQLSTITELDILNQGVASLEGLQYCTNLEKSIIGSNNIGGYADENSNTLSDLSPLSNLHKLKVLQAGLSNISNFSPLKNLGLEFSETSMLNNKYSYLGGNIFIKMLQQIQMGRLR